MSLQFKFSAHPCILINLCCFILISCCSLIEVSKILAFPPHPFGYFCIIPVICFKLPITQTLFDFPRRLQLSGVNCTWTNPALSPHHTMPYPLIQIYSLSSCVSDSCVVLGERQGKTINAKCYRISQWLQGQKVHYNNWLILLVRNINIEILTAQKVGSFKGAVSQNSARLGNYKMPVKLRET